MPTNLRHLLHKTEVQVHPEWDLAALRIKARRRRQVRASGSIVASLAVLAVGMLGYFKLSEHSSAQRRPASAPTRLGESIAQSGNEETLAFSLIDGLRGEIRFSSHLGLDERKLQVMGEVSLVRPEDELVTPLRFEYEPDKVLGSPVESRVDSSGRREYRWTAVSRPGENFVLQIGPWALYFDRSNEWGSEPRRTLEEHLWGWVNDSGFIALEANLPARVWEEDDYPALPELYIGDDLILTSGCSDYTNGTVRQWDGTAVHHVRDGAAEGVDFWLWCEGDWITVSVFGSEEKARDIFDNVSFTKVSIGERSR